MDFADPRARVASLLAARLGVRHGRPCSPTDVADYLHRVGGVRADVAAQVAWGEATVDAHSCALIAKVMRLPAVALRCAVGAMSAEVAGQELVAATEQLPVRACGGCAALAAEAVALSERVEGALPHRDLAADALEHLAAHPVAAAAGG